MGCYFLHVTPPVPFNYGYSFTRLKWTHHIGMELQKKLNKCKTIINDFGSRMIWKIMQISQDVAFSLSG